MRSVSFVRLLNRALRLFLVTVVLCAASTDVRADLRDDSAWSVLVASQNIVDATLWQGLLAGADPQGGLFLFDPATDAIELLTTANGLTSNRIQALVVDDSGDLWMGTADAGIQRLTPDRVVQAITGLQAQSNVVALDADGSSVYYGSANGAGRMVSGLPERAFTTSNGMVSNNVQAVAAAGGRSWFATDQGISEFDLIRNSLETLNVGLPSLDVRAIHADADGVWAGTTAGVVVLDESDPQSRFWKMVEPQLGNSTIDLDRQDGTLLALGVDNSLRTLAVGATSWVRNAAPVETFVFSTCVFDANGNAWGAGRRRDATRIGNDPTPVFWTHTREPSPMYRGLFGAQPGSIDLDGAGGAWIGAFPPLQGVTHWRGDGSVVVYNSPDTGSDDGWLDGPKLAIKKVADGSVWVSSFTRGVTRLTPNDADPTQASYLHVTPSTSPIQAERVRAMAQDPAGHIWFGCSDESTEGGLNRGIDILIDPQNPLAPSSWVKVETTNSLLAGDGLWAIEFGPSGTAWLAIEDAGVQRWDYDGATGSGNIELSTLNDSTKWLKIDDVPSNNGTSLAKARDLALAPDGRVWAATNDLGLLGFVPSSFVLSSEVVHVKTSQVEVSLLSNLLNGVDLDSDGDVWVGSKVGLHRISEADGEIAVDPFTDTGAFLAFGLADDYLPEIISPLPGADIVAVEFDASTDRLHLVTRTGAARIQLDQLRGEEPEGLDFSIYPNPLRGNDELHVGDFEGEAKLQVYNLNGVLLRELDIVEARDSVWDARTRNDEPVAGGLYLVRLSQNGRTAIKTLAVER